MDPGFFWMDSFVARLLQDNAALFWNTTNSPPFAISMSRVVSSPDRAAGHSPRPIQTSQIDGGLAGQRIRPTTLLSSPPSHSNSNRRPSPTATSTTQHHHHHHDHHLASPPRRAAAASTAPTQNISTPPPRLPGLSSAPVGLWQGQHFELWSDADQLIDLEDPFSPSHVDVDDPYLAAIINTEFSSPSTYPPFTDSNTRNSQSQGQSQGQGVNQPPTLQASALPQPLTYTDTAAAPRDPSTTCISGPERSTTQLSFSSTNAAAESQSTLRTLDSFDEHDFFDSPASSFSDTMPPALRRTTTAAAGRVAPAHANKRRRTSTNTAPANPTRTTPRRKSNAMPKDVEEVLGPKPPRSPIDVEPISDLTTIDLTETNDVPEDLKKPEKDDRVKIAAFQCVICMDDAANLTVTHCGHLYCASCLHQSLHVDATRGKCPMCRQKIDMKSRDAYNSKTKGFWPLELKLMTATRKGKRKANTLS
ncbi:RING-type domain-containing protein [Fusarium falciforme]|uniref:RING-type domain-containing protein n=2 Tax=Fusarium falciforme TaxID=195108 RepID=A0A9W8R9V9_9HYPO|nr:RING-type domain-containing protein [Fusarium falciforme]KAJ4192181.1 hypothetical protein NW755_004311 [Fusarium falciforme]KAJ4202927.1 hypothetical protein NW767_005682 [Fusarium falciforme]WAO92867.1 RING-type domain-containing protein [Fusarium falciforme]